jgi:hypothetical protein
METIFNLGSTHIRNIYNNIIQNKIKNKQNIILEPLQVMIQLSLLSFCPLGTKLTIQNNILLLQPPTITQPINRWFNYDKKDDIYHLFQVIKRFIKWYNNNNNIVSESLYNMLINLAKIGIDNLIKTYQTTDMLTIIPVLAMYKELFTNNDYKETKDDLNNKDIDKIFYNIHTIYSKEILNVIYHLLGLIEIEKSQNIIDNYICSVNIILQNINNKITIWINENLMI